MNPSSLPPKLQHLVANSGTTHNTAAVDFRAQNRALAAERSADPYWRSLAALAACGNSQPQQPAAARPATADELKAMYSPIHQRPEPVRVSAVGEHASAQRRNPCGERLPVARAIRSLAPQPARREAAVDPNIGRLALGLNLDAALRVWLLMRGPREFVSKDDLRGVLESQGIYYGDRQLRRILRAGEGIFWHVHRNRRDLSLYGVRRVGKALVNHAYATGNGELVRFEYRGVTYTNLPGMRPVYVPIRASLQEFRAELYAAWLQHRGAPLSRAALSTLFGVTEDTQRNWERYLVKAGRLEIKAAYAKAHETRQGDTAQALAARDELPAHAFTYDVFVQPDKGEGNDWIKERRIAWRLPNLFITHDVREHSAIGQARKVRTAARAALSALNRPVVDMANGGNAGEFDDREHRERCYHDNASAAEKARKKGIDRPLYHFQGMRWGKARYGVLVGDTVQTTLHEISPAQYRKLVQERRRKWRRSA